MQRRDDEGVEAAAIAALVPLDGKPVLEVGCGKGRLLRSLPPARHRCTPSIRAPRTSPPQGLR
jgi:2-polyprenyl-3-methyl-5-hydroxy-6-metoxy-1,4-benzoquinol methylase